MTFQDNSKPPPSLLTSWKVTRTTGGIKNLNEMFFRDSTEEETESVILFVNKNIMSSASPILIATSVGMGT